MLDGLHDGQHGVGALWVIIMGECFQGTIMAAYPYRVTPRAASWRGFKRGSWLANLTSALRFLMASVREDWWVAGALRGDIKGQD
jgi:hypothetical protein